MTPNIFNFIMIKINPTNIVIAPLIFLAKKLNVSLVPAKVNKPIMNNMFANNKNALSKNIIIPTPYNTEDTTTTTVPISIVIN